MYQIDNPTAATTQPAPTPLGTPGFFTDGSAVGGVPATIVPAEWLNAMQQELMNVLTKAGVSPSKATYDQVATSISTLIKKAGLQFSSTNLFSSGPLSLNASHAGTFIDLTSAYTGDITLPTLSSMQDGATVYIWSGAAIPVTVRCSGSDLLFVNQNSPGNSVVIGPGDTLVIGKSGPAGAWVAMWGSAQFLSSTVGQSLAPKPTSASTVGNFRVLVGNLNLAATLPAGGTWAYFAVAYNSSGQASLAAGSAVSGVAAGGTIVGPATSGSFWYGFIWRIQ